MDLEFVRLLGRFRVGLVVADDLKGGWTNRWASELGHRQGSQALHERGWADTAMALHAAPHGQAVMRD